MPTRLQTINKMLAAIGVLPVASESNQHPAYLKARLKLDEVSESIQARGAWYNRSTLTLKHNTTNGIIIIPQRAKYVNPTDRTDLVAVRGNRLYDRSNRTFNLYRDIEVNMIEIVDYDDLPFSAQDYIACAAVHEFAVVSGITDPQLTQYQTLRQLAQIEYKRDELRNATPVQPSYQRRYNLKFNRN